MSQATLERTRRVRVGGAAPPVRKTVVVDYPREGEVVEPPEYSFRVGAPDGAEFVEIRVNQGRWRRCRRSVGYWWFDWSGFDSGEYRVMARARTGGRMELSEPRAFQARNRGG